MVRGTVPDQGSETPRSCSITQPSLSKRRSTHLRRRVLFLVDRSPPETFATKLAIARSNLRGLAAALSGFCLMTNGSASAPTSRSSLRWQDRRQSSQPCEAAHAPRTPAAYHSLQGPKETGAANNELPSSGRREHLFPRLGDTRDLVLDDLGLSYIVLDGDEHAANRFYLEDLAIGLMRPALNIDIER